MQIGPLVTRAVLTIDEDDSLRDAATWMLERGVGSAVVMAGGKPTGIITDRDTLKAVAQGADGDAVKASVYVSRKLATATESMDLMEAARVMRERNFRHLIVLDDDGDLVGVFSMRDLVVGLMETMSASA